MYKSNRAVLGSSLTQSPYQIHTRWLSENFILLLLGVAVCFLFIGFLYIVSGVILFFGSHYYLNLWEDGQETVSSIYARPWMGIVRWVGCALILILTIVRARRKKK